MKTKERKHLGYYTMKDGYYYEIESHLEEINGQWEKIYDVWFSNENYGIKMHCFGSLNDTRLIAKKFLKECFKEDKELYDNQYGY